MVMLKVVFWLTENYPNIYLPLHSYGYVEVISKNGVKQLVGTSYCNTSSPFIRYNTEDEVDNDMSDDGMLISFSMKGGRPSEYILDKNGKKISLTGLIYGRHHKLFDFCASIQIKQNIAGYATVLYVSRNDIDTEPSALFDSENVEIEFEFKAIPQPIRTVSGKIRLLVN